MGQEIACSIRYRDRALSGTAYLESDHVLFRGEERLKVLFRDLKTVRAEAGVLLLEFEGGPAEFELGAAAGKWADKILNPKSRLNKLGVKAGMAVRMIGDFEPEFLAELKPIPLSEAEGRADLIFLAAPGISKLWEIKRLIPDLKPGGALWVIYPKGVTNIREIDVLTAGRRAGLKDNKVASFSLTHTGLRFAIKKRRRSTV